MIKAKKLRLAKALFTQIWDKNDFEFWSWNGKKQRHSF